MTLYQNDIKSIEKNDEIKANRFCVEGEPGDVARKLAELYSKSGMFQKIDTELVNPEGVENRLSTSIENLDSIYIVKYIKNLSISLIAQMTSRYISPLDGVQALVIGYKDKPDISEIWANSDHEKINRERMTGLDLKLVEN
jgi:hypothetical protein